MASKSGICHICCKEFSSIHYHHVYPQAYGGVHGPQVPLCGAHHSKVHSTAVAIISAVSRNASPPNWWDNASELSRAQPLVEAIVKLGIQAKEGGSHQYKVTVDLTPQQRAVLEQMKQKTNLKSLKATILLALNLLDFELNGKRRF